MLHKTNTDADRPAVRKSAAREHVIRADPARETAPREGASRQAAKGAAMPSRSKAKDRPPRQKKQ